MRIKRALVLLASASVVLTAWGKTLTTDWDRTVDFSKFKTYAFKEGHPVQNADGLTNTLAQAKLEKAIANQLEANGLEKTDGTPDLYVSTHAKARYEQRETEPAPEVLELVREA